MSEIQKSKISLGIYGDKLDPVEITKLLGCTPTSQAKKGEPRSGKNPDGSERVMRIGRWLLSSDLPETTDIQTKIENLLAKVSEDVSIWQLINRRFSTRIFCGIFMELENEGFELSADLLKRLSECGLKLDFDIYGKLNSRSTGNKK